MPRTQQPEPYMSWTRQAAPVCWSWRSHCHSKPRRKCTRLWSQLLPLLQGHESRVCRALAPAPAQSCDVDATEALTFLRLLH